MALPNLEETAARLRESDVRHTPEQGQPTPVAQTHHIAPQRQQECEHCH